MPLTQDEKQEYETYLELLRRLGFNNNNINYQRNYIQREFINKNIPFNQSPVGGSKSLKDLVESSNFFSNFKKSYRDLDSIFGTNVIDDEIYIKCNPSDELGQVINPDDNVISYDKVSNRNNTIDNLTSALNMDPNNPTANMGMQIGIGIILFFIVFNFGEYVFLKYPKSVINDS